MLLCMQPAFRDEAERAADFELPGAVAQTAGVPELLMGTLRTAQHACLFKQFRNRDVPAAHRHDHEDQQGTACNHVASLPQCVQAVWIADFFSGFDGRQAWRLRQ